MSYSKEQIYQRLREELINRFEVEPERVSLEADLAKDLDIDSIDAVDLLLALRPLTGSKLAMEDFKEVRSVGDIVDAVHRVIVERGA